jgi:hypothetical protein
MNENYTGLRHNFALPGAREWYEALRPALLLLTLMIFLALAGSFVPYERVVAEGHPWLPRRVCAGCPLCGMTRSFCAMSAGRLRAAAGWNRGGPLLYAGAWLWLFGFISKAVLPRFCRHFVRKEQKA